MGILGNLFGGKEEYICKCKKITEEELIKEIKNGNDTFEKLSEKTGAGRGACKGRRCKTKIEEIIAQNK